MACDHKAFIPQPVRVWKTEARKDPIMKILNAELHICLGCADKVLFDIQSGRTFRGSQIKQRIDELSKTV